MSAVRYSVDPRGGLRIASAREQRTASLALRADAAQVSYPKCEPVALPWDRRGKVHDPYGAEWPDEKGIDGWLITSCAVGNGFGGIAVEVTGHLRSASHEILDMTWTRWRRIRHAFSEGPPMSSLVPVVMPPPRFARGASGDLGNLGMLTTLLAGDARYRRRLEDPERMARLAHDLTRSTASAWPPVSPGGVRRDTIDVLVALQSAGFVHRYGGRPLSGDRRAAPDTVLAGVRQSLASNPYRKGRAMVDDATIVRIAKRVYFDVEPWPFAALVD